MTPSSPNKDLTAKTTTAEPKHNPDVDPNVRPTNPYKAPVEETKPKATNTGLPQPPSTPNTSDVLNTTYMLPPHSSPRFYLFYLR